MVRIFKDANSGEYVVQTSCLDMDSFTAELSEALANTITKGDAEVAMSILSNAMPIAFKLAGYKADTVSEQRTLVCGTISPNSCDLVTSVGK